MIMVQAGAATDAVIDEFAPLLENGDMIIDGGNAHFADTRRREAALRERGLRFVGAGISGGEEGALNGPSAPCRQLGGVVAVLGPMFERISAKVDGEPSPPTSAPTAPDTSRWSTTASNTPTCSSSPRPTTCCARSPGTPRPRSPTSSAPGTRAASALLVEITAEVLAHTDPHTGGAFVDIVDDAAGQKGTGRWTVQTALDLASPVTAIAQATFARAASGQSDLRAAYRGLPGGTTPPLSRTEGARFTAR